VKINQISICITQLLGYRYGVNGKLNSPNIMKNIDLTSAESAFNYLRGLPANHAISLPGFGEVNTTEGDAVRAITEESANSWANAHRQWEWTAADLVATLETEIAEREAAENE
jgi:hypothetical protein